MVMAGSERTTGDLAEEVRLAPVTPPTTSAIARLRGRLLKLERMWPLWAALILGWIIVEAATG